MIAIARKSRHESLTNEERKERPIMFHVSRKLKVAVLALATVATVFTSIDRAHADTNYTAPSGAYGYHSVDDAGGAFCRGHLPGSTYVEVLAPVMDVAPGYTSQTVAWEAVLQIWTGSAWSWATDENGNAFRTSAFSATVTRDSTGTPIPAYFPVYFAAVGSDLFTDRYYRVIVYMFWFDQAGRQVGSATDIVNDYFNDNNLQVYDNGWVYC